MSQLLPLILLSVFLDGCVHHRIATIERESLMDPPLYVCRDKEGLRCVPGENVQMLLLLRGMNGAIK